MNINYKHHVSGALIQQSPSSFLPRRGDQVNILGRPGDPAKAYVVTMVLFTVPGKGSTRRNTTVDVYMNEDG